MKIALCFSGYPRFVNECFLFIKNNLIDNLIDYDIYAYFQWDKNWKTKEIHHEHKDTFKLNELEEFKKNYGKLNLKKIQVVDPIYFDTSYYEHASIESDLFLTNEQAKILLYRFKAQYQCIAECVSLLDTFKKYDYIIRIRTDSIINEPIFLEHLKVNNLTTQNGFCAGHDRPYCDWFMVCPFEQKEFFYDLANIENYLNNGIIHMHKFIYNIGKKYNIEHKEFHVDIPSTTKILKLYEK